MVRAHSSESPFPGLSVVSLTGLLVSLSPTDPTLHTPLLGPSPFLWNAAPQVLPRRGGGGAGLSPYFNITPPQLEQVGGW